jgi:hypothetical protein
MIDDDDDDDDDNNGHSVYIHLLSTSGSHLLHPQPEDPFKIYFEFGTTL